MTLTIAKPTYTIRLGKHLQSRSLILLSIKERCTSKYDLPVRLNTHIPYTFLCR